MHFAPQNIEFGSKIDFSWFARRVGNQFLSLLENVVLSLNTEKSSNLTETQ